MDAIETISAVQSKQSETVQKSVTVTLPKVNGASFEASLSSVSEELKPVGKTPDAQMQATQKLQNMFVSQLVGELFQEQAESIFGEGTQGDFYSSVFADAIAEQLADRDILGLSKLFDAK